MILNVEVRTTSLNLLLPSTPAFSPDLAGEAAGCARRQVGTRVSATRTACCRRWFWNVDADWCRRLHQLVVAAGGGHLLWSIVIPSTTCFLQHRTMLIWKNGIMIVDAYHVIVHDISRLHIDSTFFGRSMPSQRVALQIQLRRKANTSW